MEWVALTHAHERKQGPAERAMGFQADHRVSRARRLKAADRPEPPGQRALVQTDQGNDDVPGDHAVGTFGPAVWVGSGFFASALRKDSERAAMSLAAPAHSARRPEA